MDKSKSTNLLITIFDLHFGGISNLILQTAPALMKNLNVEVMYFGPKDEMLPRYRNAGIPVSRIPYNGLKDVFTAGKKLGNYIEQNQIDIVSANLFVDKAIVTVARRYSNFKLMSTFHSVNNPYSSRNIRFIFNSKFEDYFHNNIVDLNLAVSEASLNSWKKYRNLKHKNSKVLYSGIKSLSCNKAFQGEPVNKDRIFVTACRITPEKGLERLIKLFYSLNAAHKNWQFWIIGNGHKKEELERLVEELNLREKVMFKGFQTDLCKFYEEAHFFVNASFHEALPVSILEAMSVGLPVIGSNVGGIPELISNELNGYLVDFDDGEESRKILERCINLRETQYLEFSNKSREIFESNFSIEKYVMSFTGEMDVLLESK